MTSSPACCTPSDTAEQAARLMEANDCGCIQVVESSDSNCVMGVVTDRDIAVRGVGHGLSANASVGDLMTAGACCCGTDASVEDVENLMMDRQIRRVVIVDDDGCCVGMVAQADIARAAEDTREVSDSEVGRVVERISEPARG